MKSMSFVVVLGIVASALGGCAVGASEGTLGSDLSVRCEAVRCPMPLCVQGQHLSYRGGTCCPVCVADHPSQPDHCADTACPALLCAIGEQLVRNPGECCSRCVPARPVQECSTDNDCPQLECFACPCPVSECRGHQCVTQTPDSSTCGQR